MEKNIKAIDSMISENRLGEKVGIMKLEKGAEYRYSGLAQLAERGTTLDQLLQEMDKVDIERAVLRMSLSGWDDHDDDWALQAVALHHDRFIACAMVDPREGFKEVRKIEMLVKEHGVKAVRVAPWTTGKAPNDKIYYPIYAKCVELGIPVTMTIGIPVNRVPFGEIQRPIHLDEVCWYFPDLTIIASHGAEPWIEELIALMLKWPNLYFMTSGIAPEYYRPALIQYMNTRGVDKVLYASAYPGLTLDRCINGIMQLPLRDHVWAKFLRENALRVFNWD